MPRFPVPQEANRLAVGPNRFVRPIDLTEKVGDMLKYAAATSGTR
jgi:hypothetical protein